MSVRLLVCRQHRIARAPSHHSLLHRLCLVQAEEPGVAAQRAPGRQVLSGAQTSMCTADCSD